MIGNLLDMEQLLTVADVARTLQVSEAQVRRWLRGEQLAGIQFGNEWRIHPADLQKFLDSRRGPQKKKK